MHVEVLDIHTHESVEAAEREPLREEPLVLEEVLLEALHDDLVVQPELGHVVHHEAYALEVHLALGVVPDGGDHGLHLAVLDLERRDQEVVVHVVGIEPVVQELRELGRKAVDRVRRLEVQAQRRHKCFIKHTN